MFWYSRLLYFNIIISMFASTNIASTLFYDERPHILTVPAKNSAESPYLNPTWKQSNFAHPIVLAQILTFFPDADYFFLARDIEYLHDIAQLLLKDDPILMKRLHLVPINRTLAATSNPELVKRMIEYLEQEGLTKQHLGERPAIFVDSCCSGSIPNHIANAFKDKNIPINAFVIKTDKYPSSTVAASLGLDGMKIEDMPHFTASAEAFHQDQGQPIRILAKEHPSQNSQALTIMAQIRHDYDNDDAKNRFKEILGLMRTAHSYLVNNSTYQSTDKETAIEALKDLFYKYKIKIADFIADIRSLERKNAGTPNYDNLNYISIHQNEITSLSPPKVAEPTAVGSQTTGNSTASAKPQEDSQTPSPTTSVSGKPGTDLSSGPAVTNQDPPQTPIKRSATNEPNASTLIRTYQCLTIFGT